MLNRPRTINHEMRIGGVRRLVKARSNLTVKALYSHALNRSLDFPEGVLYRTLSPTPTPSSASSIIGEATVKDFVVPLSITSEIFWTSSLPMDKGFTAPPNMSASDLFDSGIFVRRDRSPSFPADNLATLLIAPKTSSLVVWRKLKKSAPAEALALMLKLPGSPMSGHFKS